MAPKLDGIDANMRAACQSLLDLLGGRTDFDFMDLAKSDDPQVIVKTLHEFFTRLEAVSQRIALAVQQSNLKEECGGKLPPIALEFAAKAQPLGMYLHRKTDTLYIVTGVAFCAETNMPLVLYVPYANPKMPPFARSVYDFNAIVDGGPRFKRVASKQCPSCLRTMPTDVNCDCPPFNHEAFQQEIKNVVPAESLRASQGPAGPQEGSQTVGT